MLSIVGSLPVSIGAFPGFCCGSGAAAGRWRLGLDHDSDHGSGRPRSQAILA
jgi:hypothetical protein